jgi:hypothetical protein
VTRLSRLARRIAISWSALYTAGLPEEPRERRRAEVSADVDAHLADGRERWERPTRTALAVLARSLRGVVHDLVWRSQVTRGPGRETPAETRGRDALAAALWASAALAPIAAGFAKLPDLNGLARASHAYQLSHAVSQYPLVELAFAIVILGAVGTAVIALFTLGLFWSKTAGIAWRSRRRDLTAPVVEIAASVLGVVVAFGILAWSYSMLSRAQRISNAPTPSWRMAFLIAWAMLCTAAVVLVTRGLTRLVRRAPLDAITGQDLTILAVALSSSVVLSLVGVACWGVAMLAQAPSALSAIPAGGWAAMLALVIVTLILAVRALRRCPLHELRGGTSDASDSPPALRR